jgi:hypothetical protein
MKLMSKKSGIVYPVMNINSLCIYLSASPLQGRPARGFRGRPEGVKERNVPS